MHILYWIALQTIPNFCNLLSGGSHQNSEDILGAWHDYSEPMHKMEFVSECMSLNSLYTIQTEMRDKASCLVGISQRDGFSLKENALNGMVVFNLTKS
jgi:hypothetical protein